MTVLPAAGSVGRVSDTREKKSGILGAARAAARSRSCAPRSRSSGTVTSSALVRYSPPLEAAVTPDAVKIVAAVKRTLGLEEIL
jgi:hypothetical protein